MSAELSVIAQIRGKKEHRSELIALLQKVERLTQSETGCLSYVLYGDVANPENLYFLGVWKNQESLDDHNQTDHVMELKAASANLAHSIDVTRLSRLLK